MIKHVFQTGREWSALLLAGHLLLGGPSATSRAQEADAERAFNAAVRLYQGGWYDQSEKEFGTFLTAFPATTNRTTALVLQAQSRFQLKEYAGVIRLLEPQLKTAGTDTDQFLYWLAQAQTQLDQFEAAAITCGELLKQFPTSRLALEASYGEAFARYRLGDTARTVELLRAPESAFQRAAQGSTNETVLLRGNFLLAEALLAQKHLQVAEKTLSEMGKRPMTPDAEWQRQYLLARVEFADRRGDAALLRVTNLVAVAAARSNALLQARSLSLKGEILEEKQPDAAAGAYEDISKIPGVTADQKRQAALKLADLAVNQNRLPSAVQQLTRWLEQNAQEPNADLIRLTLGEIHLKQLHAVAASPNATNAASDFSLSTNFLQLARAQFDNIITQMTNSPHVGKAHLDRGWCFWEEAQLRGDSSKFADSQKALQSAIALLPRSLDHAQARFKLADCQFRLKDYTNAIAQYQLLLDEYSEVLEAREKLLDQALYQSIRAHIELGNLPGAQGGLERLLRDFPASQWSDDALFLCGRALADTGDYAKAQEAFADFLRRFQQSPLLPEVRLAVARTHARQADWTTAIRRYEEWLGVFTNHVARPQAEFDRAWCHYQSGSETNAFTLMTNLVQKFAGSEPVPLAQLWLGDHYLNQGDYRTAELYYQLLHTSTNSVPPDLVKQSFLMAAKAAFFRTGYPDARGYLTNVAARLVDDPELGPEAWFMLGDIELEDKAKDSTNKLAKFEEAINRFQRVTNFFPNSRLVPLAMGKIANCHFQLAAQDTNRYEMATNQYWLVINSRLADVATRSQAEVGLGEVLVRMSELRTNRTELLNAALTHFLSVVYGRRLAKGEDPDPFWLQKAALAAGGLAADRLQQFDEAERLYREMKKMFPSLSTTWDKRLESLAQQRRK